MSPSLIASLKALPAPPERGAAEEKCRDLLAHDEAGELRELARSHEPVRGLLLLLAASSPYLFSLISRNIEFFHRCLTQNPETLMREIMQQAGSELQDLDDESAVQSVLRRAKGKAALVVALGDISGYWTVLEAARQLSDLADALVQAAVRWLLRQEAAKGNLKIGAQDDPAKSCGYTVLAMGKLGAEELNYSSDIDLVVLYDPDTAPLGEGADAAKVFIRITRTLVRLLGERTRDGYVFRTDLRLRPDPGATQVAISIAAAAQYYLTIGQNWERAAMIRARPVAGDLALGAAFLEELQPFIWRKYLDFAAIKDVHAMKRQINAHKGFGQIAVLDHNLKLGRGGIREIEFFVQTQQLIAGGRQPELRQIRTLDALEALARTRWIEEETRAELAEAYIFLRHVEHRIQMQRDEQTHKMPGDEDGLATLAAFCGYDNAREFSATLMTHLENVQRHYAALFEEVPELAAEQGSLVFVGSEDDPDTLQTLRRMGYPDPGFVSRQIRQWHAGRFPAMRSEKARERLTEITPFLLDVFSKTADPGAAFTAFDRFLSRLPGGVQLFSLLSAQPELLRLLGDIMGTSPRLAGLLSHRPRTLEAVIDPDFFTRLPDADEYEKALRKRIGQAATPEDYLDAARVFGQEHRFRIGVRLLSGTLEAAEAGTSYAALASACISVLLENVEASFQARHGKIRGGAVSVLAMGKLGGEEMSANSDLDLVLVYDFDESCTQSDGARPLSVKAYYARLTQKLISALTVPTAEGALYEVDMRLRPSGRSGPLATSLASYRAYQDASAWIWEKLALVRARPVAGSGHLKSAVRDLIHDDLCKPRDPVVTAWGVLDMRSRIEEVKGAKSVWDIKQVRGGLVDLEFIVQYLLLIHAHAHPDILASNTQEAISRLAARGLLPQKAALPMIEAVYLYASITQILRLCLNGPFDPETAPEGLKLLLLRAAQAPDLNVLEAQLRDSQAAIYELFREIIEMTAHRK